MENPRVGDIMTTPAWTLQATDPVVRAKEIFLERRLRHLPILDGERLIGILSDRDLRPCASPDPLSLPIVSPNCETLRAIGRVQVFEVMRPAPISIGPYHTVHEAARLMIEHDVRALPVVDQTRVIGIVTQTDVLRAILGYAGARAGRRRSRASA